MDGYPQIIFMERFIKKFLLSIIIISILSFLIIMGINYARGNLAALSSVITARVTINPLEVDVSAPAEVEINKVFKVEAKIINKGEERVEKGKAEIHLPPGLILMKKDPIQEIGVIPGKKEKKTSWTVKGEKIGSYIILVSVSGELKGDLVSAQDSTTVEVKESIPPGWKHRLERFFDFFRGWLGY